MLYLGRWHSGKSTCLRFDSAPFTFLDDLNLSTHRCLGSVELEIKSGEGKKHQPFLTVPLPRMGGLQWGTSPSHVSSKGFSFILK